MIETAALNLLITNAFTGKTTWLQASKLYPIADFVDAFYRTRAAMQRNLDDLNDTQVAYATSSNPIWSLSETITHVIYSQNGYHNMLLDISATATPHLLEAARGFGEGAKINQPAEDLRLILREATERIRQMIDETLPTHDPTLLTANPLFGQVNYPTLILLVCAHEVDHVRQAILMRRLSHNYTNRDVQLPSPPSSVQPKP